MLISTKPISSLAPMFNKSLQTWLKIMKSKLPIKMGLLKLSLMPHLVLFYQEEIKFNLPPVANNSIFLQIHWNPNHLSRLTVSILAMHEYSYLHFPYPRSPAERQRGHGGWLFLCELSRCLRARCDN